MTTPIAPGAITVTTLTGNELVSLITGGPQSAQCSVATLLGGSSQTISSQTPSTNRLIYGQQNLTYPGVVTVGGGNGSIVGVRGEDTVASGTTIGPGYYYGVQGKIDGAGTIGAGAHAFGVMGQFDLSLATVSGDPQLSAVWGDMGATTPASGWGVNSSILSGQNTTADAVNSHLYTYGKASYWNVIGSNGGTFLTTGAATPSGAMKKLKVSIDGVDYYMLAAATWS